MVDDTQLGAGAREAHGERRLVGELVRADLAVRDRDRRLRGAVGVRHAHIRAKAFAELPHRRVVQGLAAEEEHREVREERRVEALVDEAHVGEGGRGDPHLHAGPGEAGEEPAEVGGLLGAHCVEAAARREGAHELVLGEVEGVVRLVEKDAAAVAHHGERVEPAREVADVRLGDLDSLGPAGRAGGEDDVLGVLARDPPVARQRLGGIGFRAGKKPVGVHDVRIAELVHERGGDVAGREDGRALDLAGDVGHALRGELHVHGHVGVPGHEAGEEGGHGVGALGPKDEDRAASLGAGVEAVRDGAGAAPQLGIAYLRLVGHPVGRRIGRPSRPAAHGVQQNVRLVF